jgi:hypothetical protein
MQCRAVVGQALCRMSVMHRDLRENDAPDAAAIAAIRFNFAA